MKWSGYVLLASAALASGALAAPKKLTGLASLGVTNGKAGGTYTLALGDAPPTFMYYGAVDANTQALANQLFDGLIEYNLNNYKIEPALAESWTITDSGKVYTFKLRQGVKWSDGQDFDADDVVFTYDQIITNTEARAGDPGTFTIGGTKVKFEKVDKYTVRFVLPKAAPALIHFARLPIMPKHKLLKFTVEGGGKAADINSAWPTNGPVADVVGTGPFKLASYTPGQKVSLVKNPNYWKTDADGTKLPYLNTLDYIIIRDPSAQVAQFLAGSLDQINISGAQFPDLKQREVAGGKFKAVRFEALLNSPPFLAFNFDDKDSALAKVFSDTRFRQAMQNAVNRDRIIEQVYNGLATLPGHGVAPVSEWYTNTKRQLGDFDLKAAGAALDRLGIKDTNGDGIRNLPGGKNFEFDLTYATDSSVYPPIATILQNDFKALGVKVNLKSTLSARLISTGQSGDWDAIIAAYGDQFDPELRRPIWQPGGALYYWHRAPQPAKEDQPALVDKMQPWEKEIYNIFNEAATTTEKSRRKALYTRWQLLFAQNLPVIPIVKPNNQAAVANDIGNYIYTSGVIPGYNPVPLIYRK